MNQYPLSVERESKPPCHCEERRDEAIPRETGFDGLSGRRLLRRCAPRYDILGLCCASLIPGARRTSHDIAAAIFGETWLIHPQHGPRRSGYATLPADDDPLLMLALYVDAS
jgi:hypothetical protein